MKKTKIDQNAKWRYNDEDIFKIASKEGLKVISIVYLDGDGPAWDSYYLILCHNIPRIGERIKPHRGAKIVEVVDVYHTIGYKEYKKKKFPVMDITVMVEETSKK